MRTSKNMKVIWHHFSNYIAKYFWRSLTQIPWTRHVDDSKHVTKSLKSDSWQYLDVSSLFRVPMGISIRWMPYRRMCIVLAVIKFSFFKRYVSNRCEIVRIYMKSIAWWKILRFRELEEIEWKTQRRKINFCLAYCRQIWLPIRKKQCSS